MGVFEDVDEGTKKRIVKVWEKMGEKDRDFFVDQVALGLSIWGSDETGKSFIAKILAKMMEDGSENLSDFGLYVESILGEANKREDKVRKAGLIIDDYRLRNALSSVPHKEIGL
ncbi:MAG: hypothetical protein AB1657_02225 [Candidatus Micrarchaeota archaeon]